MNSSPTSITRKFTKTSPFPAFALLAWLICLMSPLSAQYAGNYSGIVWGDVYGVWSMTVSNTGSISGRMVEEDEGAIYQVQGTVSSSGLVNLVVSALPSATFTGTINGSGFVSGMWSDPSLDASGGFEGNLLPATIAQYAGSYSGAIRGDQTGTWTATVSSVGNWDGTGITSGGGSYRIAGIVDATGLVDVCIRGGGYMRGQIDASGYVEGEWYDFWDEGTFTGERVNTSGPEIAVEQPAGTNIWDGESINLGMVNIGSSNALTITIRNKGVLNLTGLMLSKDGLNAADFTVSSPGSTTLAPNASTTFTVSFAPSFGGSRTAAIHIASNDADENPFDINLRGMGIDPNLTLAAGIDLPGTVISDSGQAPWFAQTGTTHDGIDAAQSGEIADNQSSSFSLTAVGPGTVSFFWMVSSESGYDYLRFYIDGAAQTGPISGEVDWQQKVYTLTAGSHTLRWTYAKDHSASDGSDCGWVDQVVLPNGLNVSPITTLFNTGVSTNSAEGTPSAMTADGMSDAHYLLIASPGGSVSPFVTQSGSYPFPVWSENTTTSKWLSPRPTYIGNLQDLIGIYTYRTTFNLTGFDIDTVFISGKIVADNYITAVRINGFSMGFSTQDNFGFDFVPISIPGGHYLAGINTLEFDVYNDVPNGGNPTGLRVELSGAARTLFPANSIEMWRLTHFGVADDSGDGANFNDFDQDGIPNLLEFAFGLHPKLNSAGLLPKPQSTGGNLVVTFTQPAGVGGVTYGAEWSLTMAPGSWQALSDTGTPPQHTFSTPIVGNTKRFVRLKVTVP